MPTLSTSQEPLAFRLRPSTLEEFSGQKHVLGDGTPLRTAIEKDELRSLILSGPPGTGKTTLAHVIARKTKARFVQLNAVLSGAKELKEVCFEAEERRRGMLGERTVLFVDEIHRFNKAQQDALLPFVESGAVILIGATTENPYFEVNSALVSRSHVALLQPLSVPDLVTILTRAIADPKGYGGKVTVSDQALERIATIANGDARIALNALELAILSTGEKVSLEDAQKLFQRNVRRYDQRGEDHYNVVSAFIKTLRGSDPDAALLWMFAMLDAGEEPRFVFRRMLIFASEDIGNADPHALSFVTSAWQAFEMVGLPEGEYFLAHACVYLAQAPKSNAIKGAIHGAKGIIEQAAQLEVPNHLRNAPVKGMAQQGYGMGYEYPHDHPDAVVPANYFPVGMSPRELYRPSNRGFEADILHRLTKIRSILRGKESV